MARLPRIGSDDDRWGHILNDYLSQVHDASGNLRANIIEAHNIADEAIPQKKIKGLEADIKRLSDGIVAASIGGPAVVYVAAATASLAEKSRANYVCDGHGDNLEIQRAIQDVFAAGGGTVQLSAGNFVVSAPLQFIGTGDPDTSVSVSMLGAGAYSSILRAEPNITAIFLRNLVRVRLSDFGIHISGHGHGIAATAESRHHRSFDMSQFERLWINGGYYNHTGWGLNLGSPFRSKFDNLHIEGVQNGIRLFSQSSEQNPGDCTFTRIMVETYGGGGGRAYSIESPASSMNQIEFIMCEGFANSPGTTGVYIGGRAGTNHTRWHGLNLEEFDTLINVDQGEGNTFDANFITARQRYAGTTIFRCGSNAWNNTFSSKFVYISADTTLIEDGNTSVPIKPNIVKNVSLYTESGTVKRIGVTSTVMRNIVDHGKGDSVSVRKFPAVWAPNTVITLQDMPTIATNAALSNHFRIMLGGNRTLAAPTNPTDGQTITWEVIQDTLGGRKLALDPIFVHGVTTPEVIFTPAPAARDFLTAVYNAETRKWYIINFVKGY